MQTLILNKYWQHPETHDQKPWTLVLVLVLMLSGMSTKQQRSLATVGDLPSLAL